MKKGCAIPLGVFFVLSAAVTLLLWDYVRIRNWGISVEPPDWLPSEATNVTYIEGSIDRVAEFDIDEAGLKNWCESIEKPLSPVEPNTRAVVLRANRFLASLGAVQGLDLNEVRSDSEVQDYMKWEKLTLSEGDLFYEERWSNSGGYSIGFDASEGRGYFAYAHH